MRKKLFFSFLCALILFLPAGCAAKKSTLPPVVLNQAAPEIYYLKDETGQLKPTAFDSVFNTSGISVLCFLSYECPLSRMVVQKASDFNLSGDGKFSMTGISSFPYENEETLIKYKQDSEISFDFMYDPAGVLAQQFGVKQVPSFYVFDRSNILRYKGGFKGMKAAVNALLNQEKKFVQMGEIWGCVLPHRKSIVIPVPKPEPKQKMVKKEKKNPEPKLNEKRAVQPEVKKVSKPAKPVKKKQETVQIKKIKLPDVKPVVKKATRKKNVEIKKTEMPKKTIKQKREAVKPKKKMVRKKETTAKKESFISKLFSKKKKKRAPEKKTILPERETSGIVNAVYDFRSSNIE